MGELINLCYLITSTIPRIYINNLENIDTMKKIYLLACLLAATACAKAPSSIPAISVASSEYSNLSCKQMAQELASVSAKLTEVEGLQRNKVAVDAATVFLVLIPVSAMSGDYAAEIGRYKGEKLGLERAQSNKSCT